MIQFPCGCKFEENEKGLPIFNPNIEALPLDCPLVWDMICDGNTKGVFQLDSQLGQGKAKEAKPRNIEELSDLSAILRPGCGDSIVKGKSLTQHYIDRKSGKDPVVYDHEALEPILKSTYGIITFQEQTLAIAKTLAGYNLQEAELLRKAIGKKKVDLMAELKINFADKAVKVGILNREDANNIFSQIEKSQKYSFNKSVTPDTLVTSITGKVQTIDQLVIGDYISGPNGYVMVLDKFEHGNLIVWEVILESGKSIKCSINHKFLCEDGQVRPLHDILLYDHRIMTDNSQERIETISRVGYQRTVDIEVDGNAHLFYGNGIATSNSHSVSYALNGYQTAYAKAHLPRSFFTSYLRHAEGKMKPLVEVNELINNARAMDIDVTPPSVVNMHPNFILSKGQPQFGLVNIKHVGKSVFVQLRKWIKEHEYKVAEMTWDEFLMRIGRVIKSNSFAAMIKVGVFDYYGVPRNKALYMFDIYNELRDDQKLFLSEDDSGSFVEGLRNLIDHLKGLEKQTVHTKRYIENVEGAIISLLHPPYKLVDKPSWKAKQEREHLGIELTCHEIDEYDIGDANCTCREYFRGFDSRSIAISARIEDVREHVIKSGKNRGRKMAFLKISDGTYCLDNITIFADDWEGMKKEIDIGKILLLRGSRDKNRGSFLIKRVQKLVPCI